VDAVARDVAWLHATLEPAASADPFTGRLLQMSKEIHREAPRVGFVVVYCWCLLGHPKKRSKLMIYHG
jgi:hypothetical protein